MNTFVSNGCCGDFVATMAIIRQLGGAHVIFCNKNSPLRVLRGPRYEGLKPLVESQSYIHSVRWEEDPKDFTHDMTKFREQYRSSRSLAETQAAYLGIFNLDLSPWLIIDPDESTKDRVVIARSLRYQSSIFPWYRVGMKYKDRLLFIGLKEEHEAIEQALGRSVQWKQTSNLLEVAQAIKGSDLFIGNQSAPCWIAMAMGHPFIQETNHHNPDSIIPRDNGTYGKWPDFKLPKITKQEEILV